MNTTPKIHPNAPPKLIKKLRSSGSFHKLAEEIDVNVRWVHGLISAGIEPTDRTEKGREVRARLFLRRRKRKAQRRLQSQIQKAIRAMAKETRKAIKPHLHRTAGAV